MTPSPDTKIPIRFYSDFWDRDWTELPPDAQDALGRFLEALQRDPYNPGFRRKIQSIGSYLAYPFHDNYVVYWTLKGRKEDDLIRLTPELPDSIDVLAIANRHKLHSPRRGLWSLLKSLKAKSGTD